MGSDFTEIMAIGKLVLKDPLLPCGIGRGDGFCCYAKLLRNWARSASKLAFLPRWVWYPKPMSEFVKDLRVQTSNILPPSAQCTDAANKTRRLIFKIRPSS